MLLWTLTFFVLTLPISIWAAWSDLKFMKIPNIISIVLALIFIVVGPLVLPFDIYLGRILVGIIALAVGFLIFFTGIAGGGDIKLLAAMLPFIAREELFAFAFLLSAMTLSGIAAHRLVGKLGYAPEGWISWQGNRKYPFGLSLAGSFSFYFAVHIYAVIVSSGIAS